MENLKRLEEVICCKCPIISLFFPIDLFPGSEEIQDRITWLDKITDAKVKARVILIVPIKEKGHQLVIDFSFAARVLEDPSEAQPEPIEILACLQNYPVAGQKTTLTLKQEVMRVATPDQVVSPETGS